MTDSDHTASIRAILFAFLTSIFFNKRPDNQMFDENRKVHPNLIFVLVLNSH